MPPRPDWPAQREEHAGPQGLVIEPGGVLVDGDLGVQENGHPLRHPRGRGPRRLEFSSLTLFYVWFVGKNSKVAKPDLLSDYIFTADN